MGLVLTHKRNQRAHVEGRGKSLDLLVTSFEGVEYQNAELKITEDGESRKLLLKYDDGYVKITDYLEIRIGRGNPYPDDSVRIDYKAPSEYLILRSELIERTKPKYRPRQK